MVTTKEHDRRPQSKQDRRLRDKVVFLTLMKRRFWCVDERIHSNTGSKERSAERCRSKDIKDTLQDFLGSVGRTFNPPGSGFLGD